MPSSKQEIQSLLTEHFRYTPLTLIDDIINTVNEIVYRAVSAVEEGLNETPPTVLGFPEAAKDANSSTATSPNTSTLSNSARERDDNGVPIYPEARAEIETGVHQLETLLESSVDDYFDRFEIYLLRNILTVSEGIERHVRLGHYRDLDLENAKRDLGSPEDLLKLRRKLHETLKLQRALAEEKRRNDAVLGQLRTLLTPEHQDEKGSLAWLVHSSALEDLRKETGNARQPITAQSQIALKQLPQLKETVKQLRQAQQRGISAPAKAGAEEERDAYIEGAVRNAIKDSRGGDGVSVGTKVGREEVSAIERMAKGFVEGNA